MASRQRALGWVALSALAFAAMALATKLATRTLPAGEVTFFRFLLMLVPFVAVPRLIARARRWQRLDLLLYRGIFGGVAVLLYFLAIEHIPVGTATLLNYSSPLASVVFAALFLGERVRPAALVPFAVAFAGMLLVTGAFEGGAAGFGRWELAGLVSAILSGAAVTAVRAARRTEGSWSIYGSFTLCGLAVSLPFAVPGFRWPGLIEWGLLAAIGATSVAAQLLMTYAYRWITNLEAGVFAQLTVVASLASGVVLLGDPMSTLQVVGSVLALSGVVGVVVLQAPPRATE